MRERRGFVGGERVVWSRGSSGGEGLSPSERLDVYRGKQEQDDAWVSAAET